MVRFKRNRYKELVDYVKEQIDDEEVNNSLSLSGLRFTIVKYQVIRYMIFISWFILISIAYYRSGRFDFKNYLIPLLLFFISAPKSNISGSKTLFAYIVETLQKENKKKMDTEIYRAISQLKNISIAQQDKPLGADFIIQQLVKFTHITKPIFSKMLSMWREGKEEEGCKYFANAIGTKLGQELSDIMIKLDQLNPIELKEQLVLYQNGVKEERKTDKLRRNEAISNFLYIPVIACALIILLNFVVVVVYIEQITNMSNF